VRWENPAEGQRDVQNVILLILTATGIVGFIPFAVGTWLCLTAAWRARRGPEGILPFALVVAMLVMSLSSDWVYLKIYWVVLAYAVASALRQSVTNAVVAPERPARTRFHATRLASPLGGIPSA
jgi:O-antigen ligase